MQPRVIAVLVARNGAQYLPQTLAALAAQVRRPDSVVLVDVSSSDESGALLSAAAPGNVVTTPGRRTFGGAVAYALQAGPPQEVENEWLWLLGHDNAPEPTALSALLGAVEVAPSVAIAGPKLMRWDEPAVIASFGETLTGFGRSVELVSGELDQAQHDINSDLLAVAAGGMLVRRAVWTALGGFDPGLPSADAALDFAVRARLAGHRVVGVPAARVASAGPAELFGRRSVAAGSQNRIHRSAQLHRRLVYAPPLAVPLHWLSLVPLAVLRSLVQLVAKRPGFVGGELASAFEPPGFKIPTRGRVEFSRRLHVERRGRGGLDAARFRDPLVGPVQVSASPLGRVVRPDAFGGWGQFVVAAVEQRRLAGVVGGPRQIVRHGPVLMRQELVAGVEGLQAVAVVFRSPIGPLADPLLGPARTVVGPEPSQQVVGLRQVAARPGIVLLLGGLPLLGLRRGRPLAAGRRGRHDGGQPHADEGGRGQCGELEHVGLLSRIKSAMVIRFRLRRAGRITPIAEPMPKRKSAG